MEAQTIFRKAGLSDAERIWQIILEAKAQMKQLGSKQWQDDYPTPEIIRRDINAGYGYVLERENVIAYGALVFDGEAAYEKIDGAWLDDNPYIVVHRLAVADEAKHQGIAKLFFTETINLCHTKKITSFRVDTNYDNNYMLRLTKSLGFSYCGIVHYVRGDRQAYQLNI